MTDKTPNKPFSQEVWDCHDSEKTPSPNQGEFLDNQTPNNVKAVRMVAIKAKFGARPSASTSRIIRVVAKKPRI